MNGFLTILFIIIIIFILIAITYIYFYNKINDTIIRVDEAEARIDSNLRDKYDLINRCVTILKSKTETDKDSFKEIIKLRSRKISNFKLDRILANSNNELIAYCEEHKELKENEEIYKASKQLELIDDELITLRNYYNANISEYNKLIKKFPTNLIADFKKYKERPFFDLKNMQDEDIEDFKL